MRIDSLTQMLNLANIRPGGRYLVVDDASGLVAAGVLTRLGGTLVIIPRSRSRANSYTGEGRLLALCDTESPPAFPVFTQMNFEPHVTKPLVSLNWATAEKEYTPSEYYILCTTKPAFIVVRSRATFRIVS